MCGRIVENPHMGKVRERRIGDEFAEDRLRIAQHAVATEGFIKHGIGPHRGAPPGSVNLEWECSLESAGGAPNLRDGMHATSRH